MAGREAKNIGKMGRPSLEEKQRMLQKWRETTRKKVLFKLSEERLEKEERRRMTEICSEIIGRIKKVGRRMEGCKRRNQKVKRKDKRYENTRSKNVRGSRG